VAILASDATCSMQCSVGFALTATPSQTSCSGSTLTSQNCTRCGAGLTLTWDPSSLAKLVGTSAVGSSVYQGRSVSLTADGNTLAVGGYTDNNWAGATWVFTRNDSTWTQQGPKLVGSPSREQLQRRIAATTPPRQPLQDPWHTAQRGCSDVHTRAAPAVMMACFVPP
jgi:hypothetical protein